MSNLYWPSFVAVYMMLNDNPGVTTERWYFIFETGRHSGIST